MKAYSVLGQIIAMNYVTVFEITQKPFQWWWPAFGLIFIVIGIVFVRFVAKRPGQRDAAIVGWGMIIFAALWITLAFGGMYSEYERYVGAYRNGRYSTVEGIVEDFCPMPYGGHPEECFSVQSTRFCYSDYLIQPGFNQSASHGGPIRAGLPVRISHYQGRILRLEISAESLPSTAERSDYAQKEQEKWNQRKENRPMLLGFSLASVVITLLWNLDWRHYIRYWVRPPYSRPWEIGFRLFFAANLAGSIANLVQHISEEPKAVEDYRRAGLYSLLFIGFFVVADIFFRWRWRKQASGAS